MTKVGSTWRQSLHLLLKLAEVSRSLPSSQTAAAASSSPEALFLRQKEKPAHTQRPNTTRMEEKKLKRKGDGLKKDPPHKRPSKDDLISRSTVSILSPSQGSPT
ncbi:hypothetical protein DM860_006269 [Cuscuta australis]|uniref:Uncharacterized protein n=1 Tax=Cuscuta australis TaxID=267555 RepID=A0A328DK35_9ASTE|nr:hypothetical protein DM860_006269 [Cuscuta australis]